ncbi:GGDEF domain-containing protein [Henriciella sp. AS95]|uniref:GGDEF domain-containing protein n=1 Tax=Henriciella sp. AS95 TaxID=3135782 RepID=UPI0031724168
MPKDYKLVNASSGAALRALKFFAFVLLTALSLATIFAVCMIAFGGLPHERADFIISVIAISACVSAPMGAMAAQNQYQLDRYHSTLHAMASTDPLTGLFNRRSFERFAGEELERIKRTGHESVIAIFDLDNFKAFNDSYGHAFGDHVLTEIAAISHGQLRGPFDKIGRWGGEEFVVLLSNLSIDQAVGVCERLRMRIETSRMLYKGKTASVTASFGIAPLDPVAGLAASLERADELLYQAKGRGRNQVTVAPGARDAA